MTGAAPVQATIQSIGSHSILLVAHSVTDDAESSVVYTTMERATGFNDPNEDQGGWAGSNYQEPEDQGGWAGSNYQDPQESQDSWDDGSYYGNEEDQGGWAGANYFDDAEPTVDPDLHDPETDSWG